MYELTEYDRNRGRRKPRLPYQFSVHEIARASGRSVWAVQKARQRRMFDPSNLLSLSLYVCRLEHDSVKSQV